MDILNTWGTRGVSLVENKLITPTFQLSTHRFWWDSYCSILDIFCRFFCGLLLVFSYFVVFCHFWFVHRFTASDYINGILKLFWGKQNKNNLLMPRHFNYIYSCTVHIIQLNLNYPSESLYVLRFIANIIDAIQQQSL